MYTHAFLSPSSTSGSVLSASDLPTVSSATFWTLLFGFLCFLSPIWLGFSISSIIQFGIIFMKESRPVWSSLFGSFLSIFFSLSATGLDAGFIRFGCGLCFAVELTLVALLGQRLCFIMPLFASFLERELCCQCRFLTGS